MDHLYSMLLMLALSVVWLMGGILFGNGFWKIERQNLQDSLSWGTGFLLAFGIALSLRMGF